LLRCSLGRVQSYTPSLCGLQNANCIYDNPQNSCDCPLQQRACRYRTSLGLTAFWRFACHAVVTRRKMGEQHACKQENNAQGRMRISLIKLIRLIADNCTWKNGRLQKDWFKFLNYSLKLSCL